MSIIKTHGVTLCGAAGDHKITLCPLTDEHLSYLYKWCSDTDVLYWTEGGAAEELAPYPPELVDQIYGMVSQNAHCFLISVDDTPIGECWLQKMNLSAVLQQYSPGTDVRRIDMSIGEKDWWGKGIGTAFVGMLLDFAFTDQKVDVLHCICEDYNQRSCRMWEKHGFTRCAAYPLPQPQLGKMQYHYRLTKQEYIAQQKEGPT